ncbi:unnamed protein product [Rangifer tarandus platyrhynchus]|uniref:Uncharacterized protein n=2 Tax=Rangifer tarandus platyrhynchus TaxID=3082113 RepID=A0ABN8YA42_RANTA|nr:unnamed protein product [Rangifer tarandus platyrhynchus]CAI9695429.1 unnamed protein product [Rangifer tarandus platyrhynchus]
MQDDPRDPAAETRVDADGGGSQGLSRTARTGATETDARPTPPTPAAPTPPTLACAGCGQAAEWCWDGETGTRGLIEASGLGRRDGPVRPASTPGPKGRRVRKAFWAEITSWPVTHARTPPAWPVPGAVAVRGKGKLADLPDRPLPSRESGLETGSGAGGTGDREASARNECGPSESPLLSAQPVLPHDLLQEALQSPREASSPPPACL